jgi:pimeloyl-ACP methyl ester carboxylesterase
MELQVDGKKVFAATGGKPFDASLPVVIFVHGAGMDHTVWALQTRWFAWHGRSVLAVDLPGHGKSDGPALQSIGEIGSWLIRLIEATDAANAALVGHSMGALASLSATATDGDRVSKLALLGVGAEMPVHPDLLAAARSNDPAAQNLAADLIVSWGFGRPAHFGLNRAPGMWMQGGGRSLLARGPDGVLGNDLAACDAYKNAVADAEKVTCPTLFVTADRDQMTPPKVSVPLAAAIAGSRTVQLSGAGHLMMIEKPDEALDALISAL